MRSLKTSFITTVDLWPDTGRFHQLRRCGAKSQGCYFVLVCGVKQSFARCVEVDAFVFRRLLPLKVCCLAAVGRLQSSLPMSEVL